jgi:FKBP-type peptidyl-prolyl cis-trans isomerase (trigger factor)
MIKDKKMLPKSRVKLIITATAAEFREEFERELKETAEQVEIQGFRKKLSLPKKKPKR